MSLKNFLILVILSLSLSLGFGQDHQEHEPKVHDETTTVEEDHKEDGDHNPGDHEGEASHDGAHAEGHETESEDISQIILHHVLDNHNWHITDLPGGGEIAFHFPWMVYSSKTGFVYAKDGEALLEKGIIPIHEKPYVLKEGTDTHQFHVGHDGMVHLSKEQHHAFDSEDHTFVDKSAFLIDFSMTKTVVQMILIGLLLLIVFIAVARAYTKNDGKAPKGLQNAMEMIIVFLRDEVARPYLGDKTPKFLPYLLTLFFFIWFANLFGMMPFNSNIAGNISFTAALAVLTFIITQVNASKDHWVHVFNTPGVPWWLKFGIPLMPIVEIIGLFTKPFALAVRLFANISAGHFMVLGLISLIFIMGSSEAGVYGENFGSAMGIAPLSFLFTIIIFLLEMIVAIIQPFIFTLLTAVFVGMAMESHDDHH